MAVVSRTKKKNSSIVLGWWWWSAKYSRKLSHVHTTASASFLSWAYLFSVFGSLLLDYFPLLPFLRICLRRPSPPYASLRWSSPAPLSPGCLLPFPCVLMLFSPYELAISLHWIPQRFWYSVAWILCVSVLNVVIPPPQATACRHAASLHSPGALRPCLWTPYCTSSLAYPIYLQTLLA